MTRVFGMNEGIEKNSYKMPLGRTGLNSPILETHLVRLRMPNLLGINK